MLSPPFPDRGTNNSDVPRAFLGSAIADFTLPEADVKEHSLKIACRKKTTVVYRSRGAWPLSHATSSMEKLARTTSEGLNVVG